MVPGRNSSAVAPKTGRAEKLNAMNRNVATMLLGMMLISTLWGCSGKPTTVDEIKQIGGKVTLDESGPDKSVVGVNLFKVDLTDPWLEHLEGLTRLESLNLTQTETGDAGLRHLQGLTHLQSLELRDTRITD